MSVDSHTNRRLTQTMIITGMNKNKNLYMHITAIKVEIGSNTMTSKWKTMALRMK
jgi:hypothetical protein